MPNKNYMAGRRFEYELKKQLEAEGFVCLRTAGSHGFADLVGVYPGRPAIFVQCKVTTSEAKATHIAQDFAKNPPLPVSKNYKQSMVVKIKGTSNCVETTV